MQPRIAKMQGSAIKVDRGGKLMCVFRFIFLETFVKVRTYVLPIFHE